MGWVVRATGVHVDPPWGRWGLTALTPTSLPWCPEGIGPSMSQSIVFLLHYSPKASVNGNPILQMLTTDQRYLKFLPTPKFLGSMTLPRTYGFQP